MTSHMGIDLSKYKVIYNERVLKAISLQEIWFGDDVDYQAQYKQPRAIEILVINEDGNIIAIRDEAWCFQFITSITESK